MSLAYSQDFSKLFWKVKIWSVVLRPGWTPHLLSSSFGSLISRHLFSKHIAYTFQRRLRRGCSVFSAFTPVSLFCALLEYQAAWHAKVGQRTRFKTLIISFKALSIPLQPAAFPAFSALTARKTTDAVMAFISPKCASYVSGGVIVIWFKNIWNNTPSGKMSFCGLFATTFCLLASSGNQAMFYQDGVLDVFTVRIAEFRASAYRECKNDLAFF